MSEPYREFGPPLHLETVVACTWEQEPVEHHVQTVVPDGCVDLIWLAERELVIAGPDTGPRSVELPAGSLSSGIRLRPGAAGAVLGLPACELRDLQAQAQDVWNESAITLADALAVAAADRLAAPGARVARVAAELGVGERQLHRRMLAAVGYGPKLLARVARLRRLVAISDPSLASRALWAGYASQAHMNDEVRRLTGTTPVRFLKDAGLTAA
jgi:AraC-like DNA-binding protein